MGTWYSVNGNGRKVRKVEETDEQKYEREREARWRGSLATEHSSEMLSDSPL